LIKPPREGGGLATGSKLEGVRKTKKVFVFGEGSLPCSTSQKKSTKQTGTPSRKGVRKVIERARSLFCEGVTIAH